jgi:hypothetical protein
MKICRIMLLPVFLALLAVPVFAEGSADAANQTPFTMAAIQRDFSGLPSEELALIQSMLRSYGVYKSQIDGLWGAGTAQALYDLQGIFVENGWRVGDEPSGGIPESYLDFVSGAAAYSAFD